MSPNRITTTTTTTIKRSYQGRTIWDDSIIEKSQDQDQGQGQGQDHLLPQRAALPQFLVLALTLTLVLVLRFFNYRVVPDIPSLISSLDLMLACIDSIACIVRMHA